MSDAALMKGVVHHLRRTERRRLYDVLADRELLARFLRERDEAAFEELVGRHGPMVRAVCRRILGPTADADDAVQAAFLVLIRKARSIRQKDLVANWLCAVAYRTARQALRRRSRLGAREQTGAGLPEPARPDDPPRDWLPLFDAALQRLPSKYREPVVLCELQGLSRPEAARHLGLNEGTLSSRLGRARDLLRRRLSPYGFPLSVGGALAPAVVPEALTASTAAAAVSVSAASVSAIVLTEGVLTAMFASKLKAGAACTAVLLAGAVAGFQFVGPGAVAGGPPGKDGPPSKEPAKPVAVGDPKPARVSAEYEPFQGTWRVTAAERDGHWMDLPGVGVDETWTVAGGTLKTGPDAKDDTGAPFTLDTGAKPAAIDFTLTQFHPNGTGALVGTDCVGIYRFDPDGRLLICYRHKSAGVIRPTRFGTAPKSGAILLTLGRPEPPRPVAADFAYPIRDPAKEAGSPVEAASGALIGAATDPPKPPAADADLAKVVGAWELTDVDGQSPAAAAQKLDRVVARPNGSTPPPEDRVQARWEFMTRLYLLPADGSNYVKLDYDPSVYVASFDLDGSKNPKWITLRGVETKMHRNSRGVNVSYTQVVRLCGIYKLDGAKLVICLPAGEVSPLLRPTEFKGDGEGGLYVLTYQRPAKNWKPDVRVAPPPAATDPAAPIQREDPPPSPVGIAPPGVPLPVTPPASGSPLVPPVTSLPGPIAAGPLPSPAVPGDLPFAPPAPPLSAPAVAADPPPPATRSDLDRLQGVWVMTLMDGNPPRGEDVKSTAALEILQDRFLTGGGYGRIRLDESKSPKQFTLTPGKQGDPPVTGIYRLDGDRLVLAACTKSVKLVPTDFEPDPEAGITVMLYERPRAPVATPPVPRAAPPVQPPARDLQKEIDQLRDQLKRLEKLLQERQPSERPPVAY